MVNRLIEPTSGQILIDGVAIATREATDLRREMLLRHPAGGALSHQTIGQNAGHRSRLLGWSKITPARAGGRAARPRRLDPRPIAIGTRRKLFGWRAAAGRVAQGPRRGPADHADGRAFGAVDRSSASDYRTSFLRLQEELPAKTILFVTHDIDEAIKMGDLVAVLQLGGHLAPVRSAGRDPGPACLGVLARFRGSDRGLKRLSLARVGDLPLYPAVIARVGEDGAQARTRAAAESVDYVLLIDALGAAHRLGPPGPIPKSASSRRPRRFRCRRY